MPGCIRDASPDAWGRRVLINRKLNVKGKQAANYDLDELTCLLESGSDRAGALDFKCRHPNTWREGWAKPSGRIAALGGAGRKRSSTLSRIGHGPAAWNILGGARPKALLTSADKKSSPSSL